MYHILRKEMHSRNMVNLIKEFVTKCETCNSQKVRNRVYENKGLKRILVPKSKIKDVKLKTDTLHRINEKEMKLQKLEKINDDYEFSFSNNLNSNNFLTDQDNKYEVLQFAAPYIQYEPSLKFAPIMDLFDQNFNGLIGEISHEVMENLDKNLHIEKDINNVYTQVMKILDNSYTNLTEVRVKHN
ncbi:hypothetical protein A3Q56_06880 [Intoshia linei]|uniref:Uncharacterized protein n=1 Tax=Intoshia linei TaxID=1819745 RepID=A0A177AVD4_9BILA|nr:hypothetical protein A3Q56_06880 [Intoshia linei]